MKALIRLTRKNDQMSISVSLSLSLDFDWREGSGKKKTQGGSTNFSPGNCMKNASEKEMTWVCPRKGKLMSTFLIKKNNRQVVTTNNTFSSRSGSDLIFYERKANFYMLWDFKSDFFIVYCFFIMFEINKPEPFIIYGTDRLCELPFFFCYHIGFWLFFSFRAAIPINFYSESKSKPESEISKVNGIGMQSVLFLKF